MCVASVAVCRRWLGRGGCGIRLCRSCCVRGWCFGVSLRWCGHGWWCRRCWIGCSRACCVSSSSCIWVTACRSRRDGVRVVVTGSRRSRRSMRSRRVLTVPRRVSGGYDSVGVCRGGTCRRWWRWRWLPLPCGIIGFRGCHRRSLRWLRLLRIGHLPNRIHSIRRRRRLQRLLRVELRGTFRKG